MNAELVEVRFGRTLHTTSGANESLTAKRTLTLRIEPVGAEPYRAELHLERNGPGVPVIPGTRFEVLVSPDDPQHLQLLDDLVFTLPGGATWRPPTDFGIGRKAAEAAMRQTREIAERAAATESVQRPDHL